MELTKEEKYYRTWKGWLCEYCIRKGVEITDYNDNIIENLFAEGKTPAKAYKELLTELPKIKDAESDLLAEGETK